MKKLIAVLISTFMIFALCACGGESAEAENNTFAITDSGWSYEEGYVYYAVKITNNSETKTVQHPSFRITAYDGNDDVLGTEEQTLPEIKAGTTASYGFLGCEAAEKPTKVEFEIIEPDESNWISDEAGDYPGYVALSTKDIKVTKDEFGGTSYTGKIVNENDDTIDNVAVTVVFKDADGKLVAGDTTFADGVKGSGETPFQIDIYGSYVTDDFEVYAQPW